MQSGPLSSPLTTWVRHTSESESGLLPDATISQAPPLPTPSATPYGTSNNGDPGDGRKQYRLKGKPSLETMARRNLWPTPTLGDGKASGSRNTASSKAHFGVSLTDAVRGDSGRGRMWPTPTGRDWKDGSAESCKNVPENALLGRAVHWRTPQARDGIPRGPQTPEKRMSGNHSVGLGDQVGGSLNPTFVEWLMNFPKDWTALSGDEERTGTSVSGPE